MSHGWVAVAPSFEVGGNALKSLNLSLPRHTSRINSHYPSNPDMLTITVLPYDPLWSVHFTRISLEITTAFHSSLLPTPIIHHVGSTSIPGLSAKPIIDIDIIVQPKHIAQAAAALSFNGYTYKPEPRGIDRMSFKWNGHTHDQGGSRETEDGEIRRLVYLNVPEGELHDGF